MARVVEQEHRPLSEVAMSSAGSTSAAHAGAFPATATPKGRRPSPVFGLTAPATIFVLLALIGPLALMFRYSLNRFVPGQMMAEALTFANYQRFFADGYYQEVLLTTLWVSGLATLLCLVAGFPVAYFLARQASPRWKGRLLLLVILPLLMGNAVRTAAWMVILGDKGLLNAMVEAAGLAPVKLMYTPTAVVIGLVSVLLPFMIVTLQSVIEGIDASLEAAAASLGAGHLTTLRRVVLPLALPGLLAGTMLCFILSMNAYATPVLIGGPSFHMMAPTVYQQVAKAMNWPFGAALAFVLMAVTLLLTTTANVLVQRRYRRWSE